MDRPMPHTFLEIMQNFRESLGGKAPEPGSRRAVSWMNDHDAWVLLESFDAAVELAQKESCGESGQQP